MCTFHQIEQEIHYKNSEERELSNFKLYADRLASIESNNNPRAVNELHFQGLYQLGAAALMDAGYVKKSKNIRNKQLYRNNVWTGKNGIKSLEDFYNSPKSQFDALRRYTDRNRKTLEISKFINPNTPINELYGHLGGSHLLGAAGYINNPNKEDKNKKTGKNYYDSMQEIKWINESEPKPAAVSTPEPTPESVIPEGWNPVEPEPEQTSTPDTPLSVEEQATLDELELWDRKRRGIK